MRKVRAWMRRNAAEYRDYLTGEYWATAMAEDACDAFEGWVHLSADGYDCPEVYYDAACEVIFALEEGISWR